MDPSIVKLLEDDEDETMHSGADVEAFQAALNRDIRGDASASQHCDSDAGSHHAFSQSLEKLPTASHDQQSQSQVPNDRSNVNQQEQSSSETELKNSGPPHEQPRSIISQEAGNSSLPQKLDERGTLQAEQSSSQNSQVIGIQNSEHYTLPQQEPARMHNPNSDSQYLKLQKISNQQAAVIPQTSNPINRSKQVPFGLLLPILQQQLDKDRAMQLQTLFAKLKKDEIPKDGFVRLMKNIVGDQMLRLALTKVQLQPSRNQISATQHSARMPAVSGSPAQFADPHGFAQLQQRSMNSSAESSRISSPAIQTKNESSYPNSENSIKRSQELGRQAEPHEVQSGQLPSSSSIAMSQERERSYIHIQGPNKQQHQHIHFTPMYGTSGTSSSNYNPYSGSNTSGTSSSLKPQPHDSQMRQIPAHHQSLGPSHFVTASQGMNIMGIQKIERQSSIGDSKRMHSGTVSSADNSIPSQQTSMSCVKKEPSDQVSELHNKHHLPGLQGLPSVHAAHINQGHATTGTFKDEHVENQSSRSNYSSSTSVPPSTSTTMSSAVSTNLMLPNSVTPPVMSQHDQNTLLGSLVPPSVPAGVNSKTPPKKASIGQKKPLEGLSSPPPPSKKQKVSGSSLEQSIEQLNDVTAVSGVDLREEEEQLFSGSKDESRFSEVSRRVVQEEEERLLLQKAPLQKKLAEIMSKCGLEKIGNDVERCLSLCVEERMRGLISNIIKLSKQRIDSEKTRHRTYITSDVRQLIMTMNLKAREDWEKKQAESEKLLKLNENESNSGVDGDKEKDEARSKLTKANKEEDDKMRTTAANVAARAAVGGDDMLSKWQLMAEQARQKREGGIDASTSSQTVKDLDRKSSSTSGKNAKDANDAEKRDGASLSATGNMKKSGRNQVANPLAKVARNISIKDVIAVLEREPQMAKTSFIYRLYDRIHSEGKAG